jgi:uncharacterized membrane protein YoaK (UPF0700 family)
MEVQDHGPLPALLVGLTVVTGLVDAYSYLTLGHVFVANMTGNVVFFGFAIAGTGGISITASLLAVLAFAIGALLGGRLAASHPPHRGLLLAVATAVQACLVLAAAVVASSAGTRHAAVRFILIGLLAIAMGGQNAVVRRLNVPDLTTTVLTRTVTGLVADSPKGATRVRQILGIVAMVVGALIGGLLRRFVFIAAPLWLAGVVLIGCAAAAYLAVRRPEAESWR